MGYEQALSTTSKVVPNAPCKVEFWSVHENDARDVHEYCSTGGLEVDRAVPQLRHLNRSTHCRLTMRD